MLADLHLEILEAIYCGDLPKVEALSRQADYLSLHSDADATLLHAAALSGHAGIVSFLLQVGLPATARTKDGSTPLHYAAKGTLLPGATAWFAPQDPWLRCDSNLDASAMPAIRALLHQQGFQVPENPEKLLEDDLDGKVSDAVLALVCQPEILHQKLVAAGISFDRTVPLLVRFQHGYPDYPKAAELLIARGADVDAMNDRGDGPLHEAVVSSVPRIVELLLEKGASPELKQRSDHYRATPMKDAIEYGATEAVRILHRHGAKIEFNDYYPLHRTAGNLQTKMLLCLLELGGDIEQRNPDDDTPLLSASGGYTETAELLLSRGADVRAVNHRGQTVLHLAAQWPDALALFLNKGLDVNQRDAAGRTALHYAAGGLAEDTIPTLVQHGGDVNAADANGCTPLHRVFGEDELRPDIELPAFQALIATGASRSLQNNEGQTAYDLAVKYRYPEEFLDLLKP